MSAAAAKCSSHFALLLEARCFEILGVDFLFEEYEESLRVQYSDEGRLPEHLSLGPIGTLQSAECNLVPTQE